MLRLVLLGTMKQEGLVYLEWLQPVGRTPAPIESQNFDFLIFSSKLLDSIFMVCKYRLWFGPKFLSSKISRSMVDAAKVDDLLDGWDTNGWQCFSSSNLACAENLPKATKRKLLIFTNQHSLWPIVEGLMLGREVDHGEVLVHSFWCSLSDMSNGIQDLCRRNGIGSRRNVCHLQHSDLVLQLSWQTALRALEDHRSLLLCLDHEEQWRVGYLKLLPALGADPKFFAARIPDQKPMAALQGHHSTLATVQILDVQHFCWDVLATQLICGLLSWDPGFVLDAETLKPCNGWEKPWRLKNFRSFNGVPNLMTRSTRQSLVWRKVESHLVNQQFEEPLMDPKRCLAGRWPNGFEFGWFMGI